MLCGANVCHVEGWESLDGKAVGALEWPLICENVIVPSGRFELPTPALGERCSIP